jgi:hypothetical protein
MKPHATLAAWQRLPSARARRAYQLLLCRSGAHAALTGAGCGLFQRRCSVCGQLFEITAGGLEPAGPNPALGLPIHPRRGDR